MSQTPTELPAPTPLPAQTPAQEARPRLLGAAQKRHQVLAELLARGPQATADSDLVHDLRVGSRRLGEVARLLTTFMDKPTAKAVTASLRSLRHAMGDLRDSDVTREHLLKWRIPGPVHKVAAEIATRLEENRPQLESAAQTQIASASLAGSMVILARILEERAMPDCVEQAESTLSKQLSSLIQKREKALRKAFGKAARKQTAASLHAARIDVKKLRYLMELAADSGAMRGAKKQISFLKHMQQLLGDHHDADVILHQLADHVKDRRDKPIKGLAPAWRKWQRQNTAAQGKRAAEFFAKTYVWINS